VTVSEVVQGGTVLHDSVTVVVPHGTNNVPLTVVTPTFSGKLDGKTDAPTGVDESVAFPVESEMTLIVNAYLQMLRSGARQDKLTTESDTQGFGQLAGRLAHCAVPWHATPHPVNV